jgi:hypothetical protein
MESSVQEFNSGGAFLFWAAGISTALQGLLSRVEGSFYIEGRFPCRIEGWSGCFPAFDKLLIAERN